MRTRLRSKGTLTFQHTAARRRLPHCWRRERSYMCAHVSTHSRPKAAARWRGMRRADDVVSTHSRPKAAARKHPCAKRKRGCFNTQPPEGGCRVRMMWAEGEGLFQHTAARRRLLQQIGAANGNQCFNTQPPEGGCQKRHHCSQDSSCFNTQPPEGGCRSRKRSKIDSRCFNTQPPEGGCKPACLT